jgi:hypothetical protein
MGLSMRGRTWGEVTTALVWERIREAMVTVERGRAAAEPRPRVTAERATGEEDQSALAEIEEDTAHLEPRKRG